MLDAPTHHSHPFPFFTAPAAFPDAVLDDLRGRFDGGLAWARHDSFYRCHMAHLHDLDPSLLRELAARMRTLTGEPMTDEVSATAQRMDPTDHALPHTDRPLLGYETARLVVQLDPGWRPEHGGAFHALGSQDAADVALVVPPLRGSAVGFVMGPSTWHEVTPTTRPRHTVVFHFTHAGNTPAVERAVRATLSDLRLGDLPPELDGPAAEAEATRPEEATRRAILTAALLHRWGAGPEDLVAAYPRAVDDLDPVAPAERLARWVVRLHTEDFDGAAWRRHRDALATAPPLACGPAEALRQVLFPDPSRTG